MDSRERDRTDGRCDARYASEPLALWSLPHMRAAMDSPERDRTAYRCDARYASEPLALRSLLRSESVHEGDETADGGGSRQPHSGESRQSAACHVEGRVSVDHDLP